MCTAHIHVIRYIHTLYCSDTINTYEYIHSMDQLDEVDSLAKEILRYGESKGIKFRPNTTGEMDVKTAMKLSKRSHNPDSYPELAATTTSGTARPHAPMQSRRGIQHYGDTSAHHHQHQGANTKVKRNRHTKQSSISTDESTFDIASKRKGKGRSKKSGTVAEQLEGLQKFSEVNSTRSLLGEVRIDTCKCHLLSILNLVRVGCGWRGCTLC